MEGGRGESEIRPTLPTWRLWPFFASCALYFPLWLPPEEPSWASALARCLPILCLALFVCNTAPPGPYGHYIWLGLLSSMLGDIIVTWPNRFHVGLSAFAVAHLCYLRALGWHPIRPAFLGSVAFVFLVYLEILYSHLPPFLRLPVAVYMVTLALMLWRALVQGRSAALGGLFFSISNALQAWDVFIRPLPAGHLMTMGTYYAAQALLAFSTVEGMARQAD